MPVKICTGCLTEKPLSEFYHDRRYPNRHMSRCKSCRAEKARAWRKKNPQAEKDRYWKNRDRERERHLIRKYGVDFKKYREILDSQGGKCAICENPEPKNKMLDVDHDHKTGKVRGLLCTSCNRMLGHAGDKPENLKRGADYLLHNSRPNS